VLVTPGRERPTNKALLLSSPKTEIGKKRKEGTMLTSQRRGEKNARGREEGAVPVVGALAEKGRGKGARKGEKGTRSSSSAMGHLPSSASAYPNLVSAEKEKRSERHQRFILVGE